MRRSYLTLLVLLAGLSVAVSPPPAGAAVPRNASYTGRTSQDLRVVVATSRNGRFAGIVIRWRAACEDGSQVRSATRVSPTPVTRRGAFLTQGGDLRDAVDPDFAAVVQADGLGRIGSTRAFGSFRAQMLVVDGNLNLVTTCDTGTVRWSAQRRRRS